MFPGDEIWDEIWELHAQKLVLRMVCGGSSVWDSGEKEFKSLPPTDPVFLFLRWPGVSCSFALMDKLNVYCVHIPKRAYVNFLNLSGGFSGPLM